MQFVSRAEWGAKKPRSITKLDSGVRGMAVHYSSAAAERKEDHTQCDDIVRQIQNYHVNSNGWADIAYNFLVCWHGWVFEGRGWGVRSAANGTDYGNGHWFAVCFLGSDVDNRDDVTDAGRRAIWEVIQECKRRYNVEQTVCHSDLKPTSCPGNELRNWVKTGCPINIPPPPGGNILMANAPFVTVMMHEAWGTGYIQVGADGGCFHWGVPDFIDRGWSLGGTPLNSPIVDAVPTPSGRGYKLIAEDGGDFNFGDAVHLGRAEYRA